MKIFCLSDNNDTFIGMRLCGIGGSVVHTSDELRQAIDRIRADGGYGMVLFTPKVALIEPSLFPDTFNEKGSPLLYEIPDRHGGVGNDRIRDFLKASAGVDIKSER